MKRLSLPICLAALVLTAAATARADVALQNGDSRRQCVVCHLDWSDSFDKPDAALLIDKPAKPAAAEMPSCLGCHDGSVGDSRNKVWLEHGHNVGQKIAGKMKVPASLPLEDGKMVCRTCHSAHGGGNGAGGEGLADVVFLRAPKEGGQLCQQCHVQQAAGPQKGSHPMGKMPVAVPDKLLASGARAAGRDKQEMGCQTCHSAHGAKADHLLVMGTQSSELCVNCHASLRPAMWKPDAPREHPQNPPVKTASQRQAIKDMGTHLGAGDKVICLSCHRMHDATPGRFILADTLTDSQLCIRCHPDRKDMAGSIHDLRKTAPQMKNRLGQTAAESGPCGACHSFHQFARQPAPAKGDPNGLCASCHMAPDGPNKGALVMGHTIDVKMAGGKLALYTPKDDPTKTTLACSSCHDPHETKNARFLRQPADEICATCHAQRMASMAGKHDFSKSPDLRNGKDERASDTGKCGFCHSVHRAGAPALWVATKETPDGPDAMCLQCHRAGGLAVNKPAFKLSHPLGPATAGKMKAEGLPLFAATGHPAKDGFVSCASCHDVHGDTTKSRDILRAGPVVSDTCIACHAAKSSMAKGLHDASTAKGWANAPKTAGDVCASCHKAHSNDEAKGLWAVAPTPGGKGGDGVCMTCHSANQWAAAGEVKKGMMVHPSTMPAGDALAASHLPPVSIDRTSQMACQTCHDPHAPPSAARLLRIASGALPQEVCYECHKHALSLERSLHAASVMKLPKDAPACSPCHAVHATEKTQRKFLWSAGGVAPDSTNPEDLCLSCHGPNGAAKHPAAIVHHPEAPLKSVKWATTSTSQPTTAMAGAGDLSRITCQTCHMAHGHLEPGQSPHPPANMSLAERRAPKPMHRPNVAEEVCAKCHGFDSAKLYLYYHQPDKRADVIKKPQ